MRCWGSALARTPWAPGAPALAGAARAVDAVLSRGESADAALLAAEGMPERAAIRAIALGTLRWYLRLAPAVGVLVARPRAIKPPVHALLVCAAHQIEYSRNAPEATVHAAVDAMRLLGEVPAAGLANAVLRRFAAERRALFERLEADPVVRTAHPQRMIERLQAAWPVQAEGILSADNEHPPMTLRVDLSRTTAAAYRARLAEAGIESREVRWMSSAITLDHPRAVSDLPGFDEGLVSVQDAGAQLASGLLGLVPGQRVLDACAAPGGKSGGILEATGGAVRLTALDVSTERMALVEDNLRRLGRHAELKVGELTDPASFWDGRPFDRILVDAPCSSTGVIRRHPDIRLLRRSSDIAPFARTQLQILRAAVRVLSPGGRLVYSTCSLLPQENEQLVAQLLAAEPAVTVARMPRGGELAPGALERPVGTQLWPGAEAGTDGFYYACLEKTTAGP
jgi:16S rRNA (cytosine967-C5)-methyltransferase